MSRDATQEPGIVPTVKRPRERRSQSRSATRALDVLELFAERRRPLRAVEIAGALDMNPSSTNQLLKTMVESGHLVFAVRGKTYLPSTRLTKFSGWIVELYGVDMHLRDLVCSVQDRTGMVATLCSPNDLFMQVIDAAIPDGGAAERGLRISLFGSAVGGAYLSTLADDEIMRLAQRARLTAKRVDQALSQVRAIRTDGFAHALSSDDQLWSIAVPLPADVLRTPTVLGLAGPAHELRGQLNSLAAVMHAAVDQHFGRSVPNDEVDGASHDLPRPDELDVLGDRHMGHPRNIA